VQVVALYSATASTLHRMQNFVTPTSTPHPSAKLQSEVSDRDEQAWIRCMMQFWRANDGFCNDRFKLIPAIVEGNWTIKLAVGSKPALTGRKVTQRYFRQKGYFEVDIDISSSAVAVGILAMVCAALLYQMLFLFIVLLLLRQLTLSFLFSSVFCFDVIDLQVRGVSKSLIVDLGITIQGETDDELPEQVLCQTRYDKVDLDSAVPV
jgi:hypothetical protein